jgi:hypothetical protein
MSHQDYTIDKLSQRLPSLLPEYLKNESPMFEAFLNAYFEYLEAEILVLDVESDIDGILNEDGTGSMLLEAGTVSPSPDQDNSFIKLEKTDSNFVDKQNINDSNNNQIVANPLKVGEYIVGTNSKTVAEIKVINNKPTGNCLYLKTISGTGFAKGETITGREGRQTATVKSYKENTILANNRLLDYSDIDHTTEDFLNYFQTDLAPSFDLGLTVNKRLTIKNIKDLYQQKGTEDSLKFLMRLVYGQDAEVRYPYNETIFASDSNYSQKRRVNVKMTKLGSVPVATDKIVQYTDSSKIQVHAESVVETVFVTDLGLDEYSLEITDNHKGTFTQDGTVDLIDRDGITIETATIQGLVHSINHDASATYVSVDSEDGMILTEAGDKAGLESGNAANNVGGVNAEAGIGGNILQEAVEFDLLFEDGGGVLLEGGNAGSMYSFADRINFTGAKDNSNTIEAVSTISGLSLGGVQKIFIETGGTNYEGGEMVVFDNFATGGSGAAGILGSVGDEVIQENHETFGQYEYIAAANQTLFNGDDIHGKSLFFNDNSITVFKNGIERKANTSHTIHDYSHKNDRVVFTEPCSAGDVIEIVIEYYRIVYEDGRVINYNSTDGRIREVIITDGGAGYHTLPKCYPGGHIFVKDVTGFVEGELLEQRESGSTTANAIILEIDKRLNRITVLRNNTHTGIFVNDKLIRGNDSLVTATILNNNVATGAGAKLFVYSDDIGAIQELNILDQGNRFTSDAVVSPTSIFPMLITTPTSSINSGTKIVGDISRATATVVNYDQDRHILKYTNLKGSFLQNERVAYENIDSFTVMFDDPYNGRGTFGGEGVIQEQFLGDKSWLDTTAANIHDSFRYQSHSYVVRVGESINKWRSIVKDLLHPAGHIFFGEVAIENVVKSTDLPIYDGRFSNEELNPENAMALTSSFVPMVIMQLHPTDNVLLETSDRNNEDHLALEDGFAIDHDLYTTSNIHLLENENSRDNFAHTSAEKLRIIQQYLTDYMVLESKVDGKIYEDHHILFEDGTKVLHELSRPESKINDERFIPAARVNAPITFYKDAGSPTSDGVFDTESLRVTAIQDSDGDGSNDSEAIVITDPVQKSTRLQSRHVNIQRIVSKSEPIERKTTRTDGNPKKVAVPVTVSSGKFVMGIADGAGTIEVQQGYQYFFTVPKTHILKFSTVKDGTHGGGTIYTTGVINYTHNNSADLYNMTQLIVDGSTPSTLYYYCTQHAGMGGRAAKIVPSFDTVLSLYPTDQYGDHVEISGIGGNGTESIFDQTDPPNLIPLPTRTSMDGKVQTSVQTLNDEGLLLETGHKIVQEQVDNFMRMEPTHTQNTNAEEGDFVQFEAATEVLVDGSPVSIGNKAMHIEDATIVREEEYFVTERSQSYARVEQNYGFGTTLRRLNMLSSQQSYDISLYMKGEGHRDSDGTLIQETANAVNNSTTVNFGSAINSRIEVGDEVLGTNLDTAPTIATIVSSTQITLSHAITITSKALTFEGHDGICLENGEPKEIGGSANSKYNPNSSDMVMLETPKYEGLRMSEFETYFPHRYTDEYEKSFANKRTNLTYSAYVRSG